MSLLWCQPESPMVSLLATLLEKLASKHHSANNIYPPENKLFIYRLFCFELILFDLLGVLKRSGKK